jgi:hypothetical protein
MFLHTGESHVLVIRLYRHREELTIISECPHVLQGKRTHVSADSSNYKKESTPLQLQSNLPIKMNGTEASYVASWLTECSTN